ncbi:synaptic vesicle membrane protein VAT-1 homolog-like [Ylistrum balloti]|uniref:synaptic vesicle membrane protein VAT-1 homolog-like n=1 Tax=Ylistrum balloti TaxID=509963 RepID=UPI002905AC5F|nr:synaptic vesicle membrane protein VAT-1 homolog-like [Ylistrum balloti]
MSEETAPEMTTETKTEETGLPEPAKKPQMRAITLTGFGGLKMLKTVQKDVASVKEGEILIRVKACGLNFLDLMARQGVIDSPPKTPSTVGFECSGEVEAIGPNTSGFEIGDRVIGFCDYDAWAEFVAISAHYVYKMPERMSFQDGAALAMNYLAAYMMLFDIGNLRPGNSVFCHSVGGGVGQAISQLCRTINDVTLFGTASYYKLESVKDNVTHLFDRVVDYSQEVRKLSPEGVDIVLDCLCGDDTNKGISLLKPMGKYVLYGSSNVVTGETKSFFSFAKSWWQVDKISPIKLYDENKSIAGFQLRQLVFRQGQHEYARKVMNHLIQLYSEGKIRPRIDSAWAFEDVGDAMQKIHDRKNIGKIILDPSLEPKVKPVAQGQARTHTDSTCSDEKEPVVNGE